jgi:hypothetical protein
MPRISSISSRSLSGIGLVLPPAISLSSLTAIEGGTPVTVSVANLSPGTYYWTIDLMNPTYGTEIADLVATSGSFTVPSFSAGGSFTVAAAIDYFIDSTDQFKVQVRTGSTAGTVILTSEAIAILDSTVQISGVGTVAEGGVFSPTLVCTAYTPAGTYTVDVEAGSASAADLTSPTFPFTVSLGPNISYPFSIFTRTGDGAEPQQQFRIIVTKDAVWWGRSNPFTIQANAT